MNLKQILCPVDLSDFSRAALCYASSLAKDSDAKLHIAYVYEEPYTYNDGFGGYLPPSDRDEDEERLRATEPTVEGVSFCQELLVGAPAEAILAYAKEHDIDLIVMGTHGRTGLLRLLMGSVAETIVRRAPCPVVTLRQPASEQEPCSA